MRIHTIVSRSLVAVASLAVVALPGVARAETMAASISDDFGSGDVQAGYYAGAGLVYCNADQLAEGHVCLLKWGSICLVYQSPNCHYSDASSAYGRAYAGGNGYVELFGEKGQIDVDAYVKSADGNSSMQLLITGFGTTLADVSKAEIPVGLDPSFGADESFSFAGVSFKVKGEVSAFIGGTISGGIIDNGFALTLTPTVTASVSASASVSLLCAGAGIQGDVDALDLELPSTLSVSYANGKLDYGVNSSFDYTVLKGDLKLKWDACVDSGTETLASYDGWNDTLPIYDVSGSLSL